MLRPVRGGIRIIKYWFSVSDDEQEAALPGQASTTRSSSGSSARWTWKAAAAGRLTPRAKEVMLDRTHIPEAPWWVVQAVDKKRSRLNCIDHLLSQFDYHEVEHSPVQLPPRERREDYIRLPVPASMYVPERY